MAVELSVLVFTEDTGAQIHPALRALLKKMFLIVDKQSETQRIAFLPSDEESQRALRGKAHAGRNAAGHRFRTLLAGKIADQLARDRPDGFVAYHADADRRWCDQHGMDDFPDFTQLRQVVAARLGSPRQAGAEPIDPARIDRLLLLGAYWELEAWLYQNVAVATGVCEQHDRARHRELFLSWAQNRAKLDDVKDTKDACCLRDQHNQELAESAFPAEDVYLAGTSFAASVDRMHACPSLVAALERTHS